MTSSTTPRPTQSPKNDKPRVQFPEPFSVAAVIDGLTYELPHPDEPPIDIILIDGSIAQLFSGRVVLRGQTLLIPSGISSAQPITVGGQTITAQPGLSKRPDNTDDNNDGGGGVGLFGFLGGVVSAAGSAGKSIGNAASGAIKFASSAAGSGGVASSELAGAFSSSVSSVAGVVSSLTGIQQSFPLRDLSKDGMKSFTSAQNLGRSSMDWMKSMANVLEEFESLKPDVQQRVRDNIREFSKPGGQLEKAVAAMEAFKDLPWEEEAPKTDSPTPTASAQSSRGVTSTTTKVSSTSASSSSSSSTPTETPMHYYIITEYETPLAIFEKFIQDVDGGVGKADVRSGWQIYETNLTKSRAEEIKARYLFLVTVYTDVGSFRGEEEDEKEMFRAVSRIHDTWNLAGSEGAYDSQPRKKPGTSTFFDLVPRALLSGGENAPYWKKMISSPFHNPPLKPTSQDPPYAADDSGGVGTTIYVLDDGFELDQPDLDDTGRTVDTFFVSNDDAFSSEYMNSVRAMKANAYIMNAHIGSATGHGTKMAIIAGGKINGVAPKANLYLMKIKGQYNTGENPPGSRPIKNSRITPMSLTSVFNEIRVRLDPSGLGPALEDVIGKFITWCENIKLPIVVAAGNDPALRLHQQLPHRLGTPSNTILTVGGVNEDGTLWSSTSMAEAGKPGSMSVYAPAKNIVVPATGESIDTGTSQAAAIVVCNLPGPL
ncbi:peptidase S8/S53 domain-containing protein [Ampelomyces quisqualis]|uniref:Peptidase S8/S53 domain-containing protein n=1 Tax=Ampelomyces quisqualis TaxID=50730 RepID=A0A6A5QU91_AMPQU|nr:peptidase S8/S53 domain-containing protein [Ampelomyces quisqualis]